MKHVDLIGHYNLDQDKLFMLYNCIVTFLGDKGVKVSYINLENIIETDIYRTERAIREEDKHHESCLSDGMEIWQHEDMEDIGGITGRLYDILHVGCGHLYQWSANGVNSLKFSGDKAWYVGSTFYLGKSEEEIQEVWDYEAEAGALALSNLKAILLRNNFDIDFSKSCIRLFNDYISTDLEYITSFYRTGEVKNFFTRWQFNSKPLPEININFPLHIQRRTNKCIALIGVR